VQSKEKTIHMLSY